MILALDLLLIGSLLWLAWRALASPDLFKGVVLFIAFGLLLALAWARLRAPDIALAEAAIGSGLTGALLLSTLGRLRRLDGEDETARTASTGGSSEGRALRWCAAAGVLALALLLGRAVWSLPPEAPGLAGAVSARLADSGVRHPVTAVLLNFRAYDTLLEIGVLLLAVVAVWAVARADVRPPAFIPPQQTALVNLLAPVMVVVAGYLLWRGATAPGGAFQAGAVLGGAGVLLLLSRPDLAGRPASRWLRAGLVAGMAVFLAAGVGVMMAGRRLLEYPPGWAGAWILVIEAAATLSIGLTLALLFLGGRPEGGRGRESSAQTRRGNE